MDDALTTVIASFERSLRARRLSPRTIRAYRDTARSFCEFQADQGSSLEPGEVTRGDVETYIVDQLERWTPSTAATRYRCLQQFWRFLVDEEEIDVSPMAHMSPPAIGESPVPVFSDDELRALLAACEGKGFEPRRDTALVRLFLSSGIRLGEMVSIDVIDLKLDDQAALVRGKGDRRRWVSFGDRTALALDRYIRERRRHHKSSDPALWIGGRGRLTESGLDRALRRRAVQAGLEEFHVHRFRHTFAHRWLAAGGEEGDLQQLAGWRSPQMLARYGASARAERAQAAYRRIDVEGDL